MTGATTCERCALRCEDTPRGLAEVFGITNRRLVATGFALYDPTSDSDVPEFDNCDRADCPGIES